MVNSDVIEIWDVMLSLTVKIILVDVFQRLMDKVHASQGLGREREFFLQIKTYFYMRLNLDLVVH